MSAAIVENFFIHSTVGWWKSTAQEEEATSWAAKQRKSRPESITSSSFWLLSWPCHSQGQPTAKTATDFVYRVFLLMIPPALGYRFHFHEETSEIKHSCKRFLVTKSSTGYCHSLLHWNSINAVSSNRHFWSLAADKHLALGWVDGRDARWRDWVHLWTSAELDKSLSTTWTWPQPHDGRDSLEVRSYRVSSPSPKAFESSDLSPWGWLLAPRGLTRSRSKSKLAPRSRSKLCPGWKLRSFWKLFTWADSNFARLTRACSF